MNARPKLRADPTKVLVTSVALSAHLRERQTLKPFKTRKRNILRALSIKRARTERDLDTSLHSLWDTFPLHLRNDYKLQSLINFRNRSYRA